MRMIVRHEYAPGLYVEGREPYATAAATLLRESGCTVYPDGWRSGISGVARTSTGDWEIECPEPRGPVSYATLAHEVAHQMLHRPGRGNSSQQRWVEETEAFEWALATFDRFDLPGREAAERDARSCLRHSLAKALRRTRGVHAYARMVGRMRERLPDWVGFEEWIEPVLGDLTSTTTVV